MSRPQPEHPLALFSEPVRRWFRSALGEPSPPQRQGWPPIAEGKNTLITAPTGSGKTLAAFLSCLDRLGQISEVEAAAQGVYALYVSPLKALSHDIERNLREPLHGIRQAARELGRPLPPIRVAVRTGDTTRGQREAMRRRPPHILVTTPESLFILLSSPGAARLFAGLRYIIVDEIHALLGNKRGLSLAISLERLSALTAARGPEPVRIGLSATVRPLEEAARFLGGARWEAAGGGEVLRPRPVSLVEAGARKELDLEVTAPVEDFAGLGGESVWPEVYPRLLELIRSARSTLLFVRMRAQAERLSRALNDLAGEEIARAHHSALARPLRQTLEEQLKRGELRALISTGTLELGIDMGAIDLVVQVGSPGSVMTGLQRVGRAGHLLGRRSRGRLVALHREDLVECAVIARRMMEGAVEETRLPGPALDVVAQHVLSVVAVGDSTAPALLRLFRQAAPYAGLTRAALDSVLGLLGGRYPAEVASGLRARLVWERRSDRVSALPGVRQLVVTAGGTIPDHGYFTLQLADGTRLGELEEEFVFERRVGDVFAFGSSRWRILEIDSQRVRVAPAAGQPAVIPFWKGGLFGRDPELSRAIGAFRRELFERVAADPLAAEAWLREEYPLDERAARSLCRYFGEQQRRGLQLGSDRRIVLEAFDDPVGDHRLLIHSCFGNRLNAAWALALRRCLRLRSGVEPQVISDDNAILLRTPAREAPPPLDLLELVSPEALEELVLAELPGSSMYGTLFRQNAARFLILGRKGTGQRTPLWLQRLRAKDLQQATAGLPDFLVRLETLRECLQEVLDVPRLRALLEELRSGEVSRAVQEVAAPSPVASGVLRRFIGQYMYEYDEPRAERTLRRLELDRPLLDQLLGRADLAELLLPEAMDELQARWERRDPRWRVRSSEELLALVQRAVVLREAEVGSRCQGEARDLLRPLIEDGRLCRFAAGTGESWICAGEDLGLLARAHGPALTALAPAPPVPVDRRGGGPEVVELSPEQAQQRVLERVLDALGPVTAAELSARTGFDSALVRSALDALVASGRLLRGAFRGGPALCYCTPHNLEQVRRRSLAIARRRVQPVPPAALQKLVLARQGLLPGSAAADGDGRGSLRERLAGLALCRLSAEALERDLLPSRLPGYRPAWLDELVAGGEVLWTGRGPRRLRLLPREMGLLGLLPAAAPAAPLSETAEAARAALQRRGASFIAELAEESGASSAELQRGLWELVWAGLASNDRFEALRRGLQSSFEPPAAPASPRLNPLTGRPSSFAPRRGRRLRPLAAEGPASGRWSLLPPRAELDEESARALVEVLLGRYGIIARELLTLEEEGTWAALYPLLKQMEMAGELGRGLFVRGLAAAQFAPAASVDRLRALAAAPSPPLLLNATDPALLAPAIGLAPPAGAALSRRPGTWVVLDDGEPVLVAESAGRDLFLRTEAEPARQRTWLSCLGELLARGLREVRIERVNGEPLAGSAFRPLLEELGYRREGSAWERRRLAR